MAVKYYCAIYAQSRNRRVRVFDFSQIMNINSVTKIPVRPFLKWAGGKRWFIGNYSQHLPQFSGSYIEPFLGSGAVFFGIQPERALLSDTNEALIETFQAIKNDCSAVISTLDVHLRHHSKDYYYQMRSIVPETRVERAARFIYLNRTCWNGLYRVNSQGQFNVPIGSKSRVKIEDNEFDSISNSLQNTDLRVCDFEVTIDKATESDFVFVDPPYTVRHNQNGFINYNESLFSWADQERLARSLIRAKNRGVKIVATNAFHACIHELYQEHFNIVQVSRFSSIAGKVKSRQSFEETVITSPNIRFQEVGK